MKQIIAGLSVLLVPIVMSLVGQRWSSDRLYKEYDREFRAYLANASRKVGKETIKVERLSDEFTIPQKLTIKGTPYEIGLTIGHMGKQARARLPLVAEANRGLNLKITDGSTTLVRG